MSRESRIRLLRATVGGTLIILPMFAAAVSCWQVYRSLRPLKPEAIIGAATMEGDSMLRITAGAYPLHNANLILNPTSKDDGYYYFAERIPAAQSLMVSLQSFAQPNGRKFSPLSHHANHLRITANVGGSRREWTGVLRHEWDHQYRKVAVAGEDPPDLLGIAYGLAGLALSAWLSGCVSFVCVVYAFSRPLRMRSKNHRRRPIGPATAVRAPG